MKIDATILLIHSYSTISIKVDNHINLGDLITAAGIQGHVLFIPQFFLLKGEKPLENYEDGILFAIKVPNKKGSSIP